MMQLSLIIVPVSHISVVSSTCSDDDHACNATFITDSTSKTSIINES